MDDELLGLLKIIAIGSGVGLLIGVIFRTTFKSGGELFVKGADGLGWGWFLAFGIFMLGLAFYSWHDGSAFAGAIFLLLAMFNFFVMFPSKKYKKRNIKNKGDGEP